MLDGMMNAYCNRTVIVNSLVKLLEDDLLFGFTRSFLHGSSEYLFKSTEMSSLNLHRFLKTTSNGLTK